MKEKKSLEDELLEILKNPQNFLSGDMLKNTKGGLPVGILWDETYNSIKSIEEVKEIIKELLKNDKIVLMDPNPYIKQNETFRLEGKNLENLLTCIDKKGISFVFDIVKIKEGDPNA
jgi:oligoribonuclease NrnB/cAMP/cGMP phosphodiesterase (DHH superfamily)